MTAEDIAAVLKQRSNVVRTPSCWWYAEYGQQRIYYAFPQHRLVTPSDAEVEQVFDNIPEALGIRYCSTLESSGKLSFRWVRKSRCELTDLSHNTRSKTRRGLQHCEIRALTWDDLVEHAWEAHNDTMRRHHVRTTSLGLGPELRDCPAYEAFGAFVDNHLAAYLVSLWVDDWVHLLISRSADAYLKYYPNNALIFSVVNQLLDRPGVTSVTYGWEPLTRRDGLDTFKLSMGFEKDPIRQRVALRPWLDFVLRPRLCGAVKAVAKWTLNSNRAQLISGMCQIVSDSHLR